MPGTWCLRKVPIEVLETGVYGGFCLEDKDSGVKDLPGVSSISGLPLLERLTKKKMALGCVGEEEVGSESRGAT